MPKQVRHDAVLEAGGLHIIGTERHESRRIDNQLRGRSGRQGDAIFTLAGQRCWRSRNEASLARR